MFRGTEEVWTSEAIGKLGSGARRKEPGIPRRHERQSRMTSGEPPQGA